MSELQNAVQDDLLEQNQGQNQFIYAIPKEYSLQNLQVKDNIVKFENRNPMNVVSYIRTVEKLNHFNLSEFHIENVIRNSLLDFSTISKCKDLCCLTATK